MTLALFYHELAEDESPLCVSPELFSKHLAVLADCGAKVLTASELAHARRNNSVPRDAVMLTFDDGFAAAVREAGPRLAKAGMRATFFCVAGHVGGTSNWPSRVPGAPVRPLASAADLAALARDGHEIGAHGWVHAPLDGAADLQREIVESQSALAAAVGVDVCTFAYPYGAGPSAAARALVAEQYAAAFGTTAARIRPDSPDWDLPRVDAHYIRDPRLLRRIVAGSNDGYLGARRVGSRARRVFRKDYVSGHAG